MTGRYLTPDPIGIRGGINLFSYVLNNPINSFDMLGLKTTYTIRSLSAAQLIAGEQIGLATAKTECENGKYYEAKYLVIGTIIGASVNINLSAIINTMIKNISSSTIAKSFTLDSNYPERYISYLDIEGHSASIIYGATLIDTEVGSQELMGLRGRSYNLTFLLVPAMI